jgi:hypothetical protein
MPVILGRDAYIRFLKRYPRLHPIIISDVRPNLHLLASAAASAGNRTIWWQDDFHHMLPPPYPVRAAVMLNEGAVGAVHECWPMAVLYARPNIGCKRLRAVPPKPMVGVAVNGLFRATESQLASLCNVRAVLGIDTLHLRLHPTSRLEAMHLAQSGLKLAPREESLDEFLDRVDIVLVGNSAVQLRILSAGVPVIHIDGLDNLSFDFYGYVKQGLVFGADPIHQWVIESMKSFYSKSNYFSKLATRVSISNHSKVNPLRQLVSDSSFQF